MFSNQDIELRSIQEEIGNARIYDRMIVNQNRFFINNCFPQPTRYDDNKNTFCPMTPDIDTYNTKNVNVIKSPPLIYDILVDNNLKNVGFKHNEDKYTNVNNTYDLYKSPHCGSNNIFQYKEVDEYLKNTLPNLCNDDECLTHTTHDMFKPQHILFNNHTRQQLFNINADK
jgi:hypothetical protein